MNASSTKNNTKLPKDGKRPFLWRLIRLSPWGFPLALATVVLSCNLWIENHAKSRVYKSVAELPSNHVGLVLGTSSRVKNGRPNLYFRYRMEAAAEAYKAGKVRHLLVSGDNRAANYNEPKEMKKHLVAKGVPEEAITLDYAGLRTLDSVVRAKKIFGQHKLTIITQKAHAERAVFIASHHGIDAVAFAAKDVPIRMSTKTRIREWLARCKAVLDLYLLNKQPRHLGNPEPIAFPGAVSTTLL